MVKFGPLTVDEPHKETGYLPAGEYRTGEEFGLPIAVINGSGNGDTIYLQSVSDGDELNGLGVIQKVYREIEPDQLNGTILMVGILNIHGFKVSEHNNPVDGKKINRVFPGNKSGTSSERLAHLVYTEGIKKSDLAIDLHQGSTSRMINEVRVRCGRNHRLHGDCMELAKTFGFKHILDKKGPKGQLARVGPDDGIPVIDPELGGSIGWDQSSIDKGFNGVMNVLRRYGFLEEEGVNRGSQVIARDFHSINADRGGVVDFSVDLYDVVEEGDELFSINTPFGEEKDVVHSDVDGVVWRIRRLPMVASGEYILSIGTGLEED